MLKKIFMIFRKDAKISTRDAMLFYIIVIPILMAIGIQFLAPGISDSSITIAMLDGENVNQQDYMSSYIKIELYKDLETLERRVLKRDDVVAIVETKTGYELIVEGNEDPGVLEIAQMVHRFYQADADKDNSLADMYSFEKTVHPLKSKLANMLILLVIMLAGMIISLGLVEEKSDNTISAMNVTPVSQNAFIIGKSLLGGFVALGSIVISLLILGYYDINWFMIILVGFTTMILTFVVGFLQGINSSDVIEAAAGVKLMMLPIAGSIAGYEFLSDKWQWTMYWSPFYWAYKANDMILSKEALWLNIFLYSAIVFVISIVIFLLVMPSIRKGLSKA